MKSIGNEKQKGNLLDIATSKGDPFGAGKIKGHALDISLFLSLSLNFDFSFFLSDVITLSPANMTILHIYENELHLALHLAKFCAKVCV